MEPRKNFPLSAHIWRLVSRVHSIFNNVNQSANCLIIVSTTLLFVQTERSQDATKVDDYNDVGGTSSMFTQWLNAAVTLLVVQRIWWWARAPRPPKCSTTKARGKSGKKWIILMETYWPFEEGKWHPLWYNHVTNKIYGRLAGRPKDKQSLAKMSVSSYFAVL